MVGVTLSQFFRCSNHPDDPDTHLTKPGSLPETPIAHAATGISAHRHGPMWPKSDLGMGEHEKARCHRLITVWKQCIIATNFIHKAGVTNTHSSAFVRQLHALKAMLAGNLSDRYVFEISL